MKFKRKYIPPKMESSDLYETMALGCGQCSDPIGRESESGQPNLGWGMGEDCMTHVSSY
jgi:hypothetical protein